MILEPRPRKSRSVCRAGRSLAAALESTAAAWIERVHRDAPHATSSTDRNAGVNLRDELESGKVDLAVGPLPQLKAGFFQRRLFTQRYVCRMRAGDTMRTPVHFSM